MIHQRQFAFETAGMKSIAVQSSRFSKPCKRWRERANVQRLGGDIEKMREQAPDLAVEHADELGALGHLEAEQLFRRQAEGVLLVHGRDVVEAVEVAEEVALIISSKEGIQ